MACYPVLRMGAPEHSPWRAPRDDLNDCPYQGTVLDFSIFQPYEVALVGEPGEADTQTLITPSTPPTCPTRWSPVAPRTTRRTRGSYPFWRIAPRAMAGRPPTSVKATPTRTRRPTRRGWRGCSRLSFVLAVCRRSPIRTTTGFAFFRRCPRRRCPRRCCPRRCCPRRCCPRRCCPRLLAAGG